MRSFKWLFLGVLIFGILVGYSWSYLDVPSYLIFVNEAKQDKSINYSKLTLQNCAPRGEQHGETWVGNDIVDAFSKHFSKIEQIFQGEHIADDSGFNLYLRGYMQYVPPFPDINHVNVAYILYPLFYSSYDANKIKKRDQLKVADYGYLQVFFDELQFYDAMAVASERYAEKMREAGFKTYYVPQFTNPKRFYFEYDENVTSEVLFIGSRPHKRKASKILLKYKDIPLSLYGPENDGFAIADYVDNNELHKYYSSAKIVLNDHRDDMRLYGFINNRTFDVTASGGFLISDYMPEIEKIYGDSIPMWKTEEELVALVKYYLNPEHEAERQEKARRAQQITLHNFTADIVIEKIYHIMQIIKQQKEGHL